MVENVLANEKIGSPVVVKTEKKPLPTKLYNALLPCALFVAVLYYICFSYNDVPQVSFTLFCPVLFGILYYILKKGEFIKQQVNIYCWFLAVVSLALCNGIFSYNSFTESNIVVMCMLLAFFTLTVTAENPQKLYSVKALDKVFALLVGSMSAWFGLPSALNKLYVKTDNPSGSNVLTYFYKILKGVLYAIPFLFVITLLLLKSDSVFYVIISEMWHNHIFELNIFRIVMAIFAFVYFLGYIYKLAQVESKKITTVKIKTADKITSITFLTMLNLLFLTFSIIQFAFLFTGGQVVLPDGITYSEYAREGFFELLFVTIINFSVILFFTRYLKTIKRVKIIKYLLVALCVFTGILIISSFYRMNLYITAYAYTSLRLKVITFLLMESILILGTIRYLFKQNFNLAKLFIITGFIFYLIVNFSASDYVTTALNIDRFKNNRNAFIDLNIVGKDGAGLIFDLYKSEEFLNKEYLQVSYVVIHNKIGDKSVDYCKRWLGRGEVAPIDDWQNWSLFASISYDKKQALTKS